MLQSSYIKRKRKNKIGEPDQLIEHIYESITSLPQVMVAMEETPASSRGSDENKAEEHEGENYEYNGEAKCVPESDGRLAISLPSIIRHFTAHTIA